MTKIELLKKLVEEGGTDKMKELVLITENYLPGLNNMFRWREVDKSMLQEFDLPMFFRELQEQGKFENRSGMEIKFLMKDVFCIARHVWEFVDENGVTKNGDDLHKAWSSMFEGETMMSVEELYKDLQYY